MPKPEQTLLPLPVLAPASPQMVVRIEKNLNSLGFFSPTASTGKRNQEKVVSFTRELPGGVKTEGKATILGTSRGLPNTADLDKYLAFQLIVADLKKKNGTVSNPIGFTTYQLLRLLGLKPTGKRYAEVDQWLDRMAGTLIKSEGAVYFAKRKRYMRDRFHVFEKVYTVGEELPGGGRAEQNYVFLSDWQLENLNHGYVLPIALEYYQQLKSDIAKNLVPLLYIWFYACRRPFQKRYQEICKQLNIKVWTQFSRAREQFSPALTELNSVGYIADWDLCRTIDGLDFKLILAPGAIFKDEATIESFRQRDDNAIPDADFNRLVGELVSRGITEKAARRLLFANTGEVDVMEQLEWIDYLIGRDPRKFENPAGVYVSFLRDGIVPPASFISSRRRKEIERLEQERRTTDAAEAARRCSVEARYAEYREQQVKAYIAALPAAARTKLAADSRKGAARYVAHFDALTREQQDDLIERVAFKIVLDEIPLLTVEEFEARDPFQQMALASSEGR